MGWLYFCILAWIMALMLAPRESWKCYWPIGIFAMATIYLVDSTFVSLNAFRFNHAIISIGALPLLYWLSYFPGGILFAHYRPRKGLGVIVYILVTAFLLLVAELAMMYFGYFQHIRWSVVKSFMLNIFGFIVTFWFNEFWEHNKTIKTRT